MNNAMPISRVPPTPASASTRDGQTWNPQDNTWRIKILSGTRRFYFSKLEKLLSEEMCRSTKHALIHYLRNLSVDHACNCYGRYLGLIKFAHDTNGGPLNVLPLEAVIAYRATLNRRTEWYLGVLRAFFQSWHDLRLPGLDPNLISWFGEIRLKGNQKGEAILTSDPDKGPFSDVEFNGILAGLNDQFAKGGIDLAAFVLVWLYMSLGPRSVQLAALKIKDFRKTELSNGGSGYLLQMPRAKQRGNSPRSEFKARRIVPEVGRLIERHVSLIKETWGHLETDMDELPLFIEPSSPGMALGFKHHCTSQTLAEKVNRIFKILAVQSERTNRQMKITTRRFRYTRGTRAAAEGASELVIAELLDHTDTQNVGVYVKATPEIIERIDRAMAMFLAPMAQAFAGQLIEGEGQARRAGDPRSRIVAPAAIAHPIGSCGSFGFCAALAPIACYTCRNFQPWRDGPHEDVLQSLLGERERMLAETGDMTIAAINDRTILACAEVVRRCEEPGGLGLEA